MYQIAINDNLSLITPEKLSQAIAALPEWRRERTLRFKHQTGQVECAYSYHMLCQLLREHHGITLQPHFLIGEHGKPTLLEYPHIHFNISHCRRAIAVAISDQPIGIDVEVIGRENDSLAHHVLNARELHQMQSSPNPSALFAQLWTQKEALFKLLSTGITDDIPNLLTHHSDIHFETQINSDKQYALSIAQHSRRHAPTS